MRKRQLKKNKRKAIGKVWADINKGLHCLNERAMLLVRNSEERKRKFLKLKNISFFSIGGVSMHLEHEVVND